MEIMVQVLHQSQTLKPFPSGIQALAISPWRPQPQLRLWPALLSSAIANSLARVVLGSVAPS